MPQQPEWVERIEEIYDKTPAFNNTEAKRQLVDCVATLLAEERARVVKILEGMRKKEYAEPVDEFTIKVNWANPAVNQFIDEALLAVTEQDK